MKFGVDISTYQENVDYKQAVSVGGVEFAILRAGYSDTKDDMFERHYNGFSGKIPLGAYLYSYAKTVERVRDEAAAMLSWCKDKPLELPLYLDMEERSSFDLGKNANVAMALEWCRAIKEGGRRPGIYANTNWWRNVLDADAVKAAGGSIWVAQWSESYPSVDADVWQFGGHLNFIRGTGVAGIADVVDQNYILHDSVIEGGGDGEEIKEPEANPEESEDDTVKLRMLEAGMTGADVAAMQMLLIGNDYEVGGYGADGIFGSATRDDLRKYQRARGLADDGICGPLTWSALLGVT